MKSPKNFLLTLLALATAGVAVLAWRQQRELAALRTAALQSSERADLQRRIWDLERRNRDLADRAGAPRGETESPAATAGAATPASRPDGPPRGGRGNPLQQVAALRAALAKPDVQAMIAVQQKALVDARYAALFRQLGLPAAQRAKVEALMTEFQNTGLDVLTVATEQGVRDPQGIRQLMEAVRADYLNGVKAALGDAAFQQFQNYEQTLPQRALVNQLQQRLSSTDTPLSPAQADQLVTILATNAPATTTAAPASGGLSQNAPPPGGPRGPAGPGGDAGAVVGALLGGDFGGAFAGFAGGPGTTGATAVITPAAVNQSQAVLSAPQVSALQQLQQQQQTAQQLQQIIREVRGAPPAPPPGAVPSGPRGGG
ncbi:MAG: hypothetical protein RLZZ15_1607 [Verrucomicrobiota bacterium]